MHRRRAGRAGRHGAGGGGTGPRPWPVLSGRAPAGRPRTVGTVEVLWEYALRPEFGLVYPQLHAVDGGVVSNGGATVLVLSTDAPLTVEGSTATGTAVLTVGEHLTWVLQQADAWEPLWRCGPPSGSGSG